MNFYRKHIPEEQEILQVLHQHWIVVFDRFILWLSFGAFIPAFLYYQSERLREIIPFYVMEIFLFLVFTKILYELYNWYYDAWVITDTAIYDIEWSLLKTNVESVHFESIEWVEVEKHRIWDSILNKGDIVIHKFWDDEIALHNVFAPYAGANLIESLISHEEPEEEVDRFDMIMDTLSWVVKEYLERNGTADIAHPWFTHEKQQALDQDENEIDDYTLDLRNETSR